jgi:hypothetical protein
MRAQLLMYRLCAAGMIFCWSSSTGRPQTMLPTIPEINRCAAEDFDNWLLGNVVKTPKNSEIFSDVPALCDFYLAAEHVFFWLTSPPPANYGVGQYVFLSPVFRPVSVPDRDGHRNLVYWSGALSPAVSPFSGSGGRGSSAKCATAVSSQIFDAKLDRWGSKGTPIVFDPNGKPHDLFYATSIATGSEPAVEISRVQSPRSALPIFIGKDGQTISSSRYSRFLDSGGKEVVLDGTSFVANGIRYFVAENGDVLDFGTRQTDDDRNVLMTQDRKVVYYTISVNDVYAFLHDQNPNQPPAAFPTDVRNGAKFPDADALAVAVKTAWIEVDGKSRAGTGTAGRYLTIDACIPTYDATIDADHFWIRKTETRPATLGLVGMHIAFAANNQPQMVWATFENIYNARNRAYGYRAEQGNGIRAEDGKGSWTFSDLSGRRINEPRMHVDECGNIVAAGYSARKVGLGIKCDDVAKTNKAVKVEAIGAINVRRESPWGTTDPVETTHIIGVNESFRSFLDKRDVNDVRKNYLMIGVIWGGRERVQGSEQLANSTMETFQQKGASNCLSCHQPPKLSQIWEHLTAP